MNMTKSTIVIIWLTALLTAFCGQLIAAEDAPADMTEIMKQSLVRFNISAYRYEQHQPWRHADVSERSGFGCAVGEYQVLTTAYNVADAAFIKVRKYGQNEFIPATVKVVDYESNLCLLELDPNAMGEPLKAVEFVDEYNKGAEVNFYWLSSAAQVHDGRGYLDRATVIKSTTSYSKFINYIASNTSTSTTAGQLYCIGRKPIGIACWANQNKEAGLIPAQTINNFLADIADGNSTGFGAVGFKAAKLLDPSMRTFLKIPASMKEGILVADVYNLGTGSDILKADDVILAIDGQSINSNGRYEHSKYERLLFDNLITGSRENILPFLENERFQFLENSS